jgi:hypothetical protein
MRQKLFASTKKELTDMGWFYVGKKHYIHISGCGEVNYDCNTWLWITDDGERYYNLYSAVNHIQKREGWGVYGDAIKIE